MPIKHFRHFTSWPRSVSELAWYRRFYAGQAFRACGAHEVDAPGGPGHDGVGHAVDDERPAARKVQPEDGGHGAADREAEGEQKVEGLGAATAAVWLRARAVLG